MEKKYILTDETITLDIGIVVHRIKAIRSFGDVNEGDLGGWIEKEGNLSHDGDCWVYNNAIVCDNAIVYGNARILNNAQIFDYVTVFDNATVFDNVQIFDNAEICGNATVYSHAKVRGNAHIRDNAKIYGHAYVCDNAEIIDNAKIYGNAYVRDNAIVYGNARVFENATVFDNAQIFDDAYVCGNAVIRGNLVIQSDKDYIVFKNWWSSGRYFTWTRSNNMWCVGCFYGTGGELVKKAYKDSRISGREYKRIVKYVKNMLLREKITNFFKKTITH